ncbi:MAG: TolC family protein, partial [Verrucomicrobia bacterium]|nr:TolC family protein [Verrucomicrobiota bacterium]
MLFSGCATYKSAPIQPKENVECFSARRLDSPHLAAFIQKSVPERAAEWPPQEWDFQSLAIVASYYHPDLQVARAEWEVASQAIITAGMYPNPVFTFIPEHDKSPSASKSKTKSAKSAKPQSQSGTLSSSSPTQPSQPGVSRGPSPKTLSQSGASSSSSPKLPSHTLTYILDITIETAGRLKYRVEQATHQAQAGWYQIANTAWNIRSRVRYNLVLLYSSLKTIEYLEESIVLQKEVVQAFRERYRHGEASYPDLLQQEIVLRQIELSLREAKKVTAVAKADFASSLGLSVAGLDNATISFAACEMLLGQSEARAAVEASQALLNRSDLLALLAEYAASDSALKLEIAKQIPNLTLGPSYEWDQGTKKWKLGFTFELPIFNQNQGPIAEAEAARKALSARFLARQTQVLREVETSLGG